MLVLLDDKWSPYSGCFFYFLGGRSRVGGEKEYHLSLQEGKDPL